MIDDSFPLIPRSILTTNDKCLPRGNLAYKGETLLRGFHWGQVTNDHSPMINAH
jgi:hypothetical protein